MGAFGTKRDELTDTVKKDAIMPFRMAQIMKTAADITERLVSGKYLYIGNTKGVMTYRDTSIDHRKVWQWKICQYEKLRGQRF